MMLSETSQQFYDKLAGEYDFESHQFELLRLACEALDRASQAEEVINREGITYDDRFGTPRTRPEVRVKVEAENAFRMLIKQLNLDEDESRPVGRPPGR